MIDIHLCSIYKLAVGGGFPWVGSTERAANRQTLLLVTILIEEV